MYNIGMVRKILIGVGAVLILCVSATLFFGSDPKQSEQASVGTYVSMGDSVAAGLGLSEPKDSSACGRSQQSYPSIVAERMNYELTDISCSGAMMSRGITGKQTVNQLDLPAQQLQLYELKKPDLVSLTIGANDANWTTFLQQCYTGNCATDTQTQAVNTSLETLKQNLDIFFKEVNAHYDGTPPKFYITGYYSVVPEDGDNACQSLTGIDANERTWIKEQLNKVDAVIVPVVSDFKYATYVDVSFKKHQLCVDDSWVQSIQDKAPFHPTEDGQKAYAKALQAAIKEAQ